MSSVSALSFVLSVLFCFLSVCAGQMEVSNCSFDLVPRTGAYYIDTNAWITQIELARFNLTCDLVANFTVRGRFNLQPSGQPIFSKKTTVTYLGRWDTITDGSNCSCSCSGTMILAPSLGPSYCSDSNALEHPDDPNFCRQLSGIQDYFIGTYYWAMDDGNLLLSRTGVMPGRAATFTTGGELMPYTSFPGTYWGYAAAYITKNCSLTPAPPTPGPPPPPGTPWTPTSVGACCNRKCITFSAGLNTTDACQITTYENCLTLGVSWAFKGPGTTCTDGSCAGSCCCDTACADSNTATPFACSQQCNSGQWYGADNYYSCTDNPAGSCLACINQAPPSAAYIYKYIDPPPIPTGICYYNGCVTFPTTLQVCSILTEAQCYQTPGYSWTPGSDCYSGYLRKFCITTSSAFAPDVCGLYNWPNALATYQSFVFQDPTGTLAYWYGDGTDPGCTVGNAPPPGGCPTCTPYVPPPPPPTPPPPPPSISLPDFNATGACCKVGCSDSGQIGQVSTGCQTIPRSACSELQRISGDTYLYKGDGTTCGDGVSCVSSCCCPQPTPGDYSCSQLTSLQCAAVCPTDGVFGGLASDGSPKPCPSDPNTCTAGVDAACLPMVAPTPVGCCAKTWCDDSHASDNAVSFITAADCAALSPGPGGQPRTWMVGGNCDVQAFGACCCKNHRCMSSSWSASACDAMCGNLLDDGRWYGHGSWQDCGLTDIHTFTSLGCPKCVGNGDWVTNCGPNFIEQLLNIGVDAFGCIAGSLSLDFSACIGSAVKYGQQFTESNPFQTVPLCPQNYGFGAG